MSIFGEPEDLGKAIVGGKVKALTCNKCGNAWRQAGSPGYCPDCGADEAYAVVRYLDPSQVPIIKEEPMMWNKAFPSTRKWTRQEMEGYTSRPPAPVSPVIIVEEEEE